MENRRGDGNQLELMFSGSAKTSLRALGLSEVDGVGRGILYYLAFSFIGVVYALSINASEIVELTPGPRGIPLCRVKIGQQEMVAEIDTGSSSTHLREVKAIANDFTPMYRSCRYRDFRGEISICDEVSIHEISWGQCKRQNILALLQSRPSQELFTSENLRQALSEETSVHVDAKDSVIYPVLLGQNAFEEGALMIDLPHCRMVVFTSDEDYSETVEGWIEASLEQKEGDYLVAVSHEGILKKFVVDTGATINVLFHKEGQINPEKTLLNSTDFKTIRVGDHHLETETFIQANSRPSPDLDGLLGVAFLKDYPVLIDFQKKKVFIKPQSESS